MPNDLPALVGSGSHIAGYVGVSDDSFSHYLKAGLYYTNSGSLVSFISYSDDTDGTHFISEQYASTNTNYFAKVTKIANGAWTAQIGAHQLGYNINLNGMTKVDYFAESQAKNTTQCAGNQINFSQSNQPIEGMHQVQDYPYGNPPTCLADYGWISEGPGQGVCPGG